MGYNVELLTDMPVLLVTVSGSFSMEDFFQIMNRVGAILEEQPEPVFHITDFRESEIPLDELMIGANEVARGDVSLFSHPNICENIFVTGSDYMAHVARGLDSEVFGNIPVSVFATLDEALDHVREQA